MDFNNEKFISNFIENQFPRFYQEDGPDFILFVKAYYEWLESTGVAEGDGNGGPVREARELLTYRDIDGTIERFLEFFQKKYLYGIPFNIISNKRFLLKHILDVYRSKGTIQCYRLLFKLIYNEDVKIYLPADDMLRVSDGTWYEPKYIEVTENNKLKSFVGKIVVGVSSGTRASVEDFVRETVDRDIIDILYISNVSPVGGDFIIGEKIVLEDEIGVLGSFTDYPTVLGSLNSVDIIDGGTGFGIGSIVKIAHNDLTNNQVISHGVDGLLRVKTSIIGFGQLNYDIVFGGFGYTTNALCLTYKNVLDTTGFGTRFGLTSLGNTYNITYNTDIIYDYANLQIGASTYGFPGNPSANSWYAFANDVKLANVSYTETPVGYNNTDIITVVNVDGVVNGVVTFTTNSIGGNLVFTVVNTGMAFSNSSNYIIQVSNSTGGTATGNNDATIFSATFTNTTSNNILSFNTQTFGSIYTLSDVQPGRNYTQPVDVFVRSTQLSKTLSGNVTYNSGHSLYSISANGGTGYSNTDVIVFRGPISNLNITDNRTTNPAELHGIVSNTSVSIIANTSGYSNTAESILISNAGVSFFANDVIYYMVPSGNTAIGGLTGNSYYYVSFSNSSSIVLKSTLTGANVDITGNVTSNGQTHYIYIGKKITANTTGFSNTADVIQIANANVYFNLNDRVYYRVPASNTAVAGLSGNTWYYVNFVNSSSIALANSQVQASNDATVTMVTNTSGGNLVLTITSSGNGIVNSSAAAIFANSSGGLSSGSGANLSYSLLKGHVNGDNTKFTEIFSNGDVMYLQANSSAANTGESQIIKYVVNSTSIFLYGSSNNNSTSSAIHKASPVILPSQLAPYETYMYRNDGTINGVNEIITAVPSNGNDVITFVNIVNSGKGYVEGEFVKLYIYGSLTTPIVRLMGSNYSNGDVIVFSGGGTNDVANGYITTYASNGSINFATLTSAGSGYESLPRINIKSANGSGADLTTSISGFNPYNVATGRVVKKGIGRGKSYWTTTRGFLDSDKYIQDSYYYQTYSYEIEVPLTLDKYKDILYTTFHSAGSELFGKFVLTNVVSSNLAILKEPTSACTAVYVLPSLRADSTDVTVDTDIFTVDAQDA